jgi:hypothetical protein
MGIGRQVAICEYIEIMQILPGSSDDARLINASRAFGKMGRERTTHSELKIQKLQPLPHSKQRDSQRKR